MIASPLQNPVTGHNAYETYEGNLPFWQAIDNAFRKYLLTTDSTDSKTLYYYNQVRPQHIPIIPGETVAKLAI